MSILPLIIGLLFPLLPPSPTLQKINLTVEIQNVRSQTGAVYVAVYRPSDAFPTGEPSQGKKLPASGTNVKTSFSVEPGRYAVAVYHDENNNGKMDKRVFGIPKEPYGFSNNFRPTISAPKFTDCQFSIGTTDKAISIKLD